MKLNKNQRVTAIDLDFENENVTDVNDVFKKLFKNPSKLMNLVTNISSKLDKKMKDGSLKESELIKIRTKLMSFDSKHFWMRLEVFYSFFYYIND